MLRLVFELRSVGDVFASDSTFSLDSEFSMTPSYIKKKRALVDSTVVMKENFTESSDVEQMRQRSKSVMAEVGIKDESVVEVKKLPLESGFQQGVYQQHPFYVPLFSFRKVYLTI